jgi:hypothetical protein
MTLLPNRVAKLWFPTSQPLVWNFEGADHCTYFVRTQVRKTPDPLLLIVLFFFALRGCTFFFINRNGHRLARSKKNYKKVISYVICSINIIS